MPEPDIQYVRLRSRYPNRDGSHAGIFGLVNVLGRHGMLTVVYEDEFHMVAVARAGDSLRAVRSGP